MDHARHTELASTIETIVTSGDTELDKAGIALIKLECKEDPTYVETAKKTVCG